MIYFTADLHLGHRHALESMNRPFNDIEEMNESLIYNINRTVKPEDELFILGDFAFRIPKCEAIAWAKLIKCKKTLITGNHDLKYPLGVFEGIYDFLELKKTQIPLSLMHYPMLQWPKSRYGSIHLHGHMHNHSAYNLNNKEKNIKRYDVGVDANHYAPVSLEFIYEFFKDC